MKKIKQLFILFTLSVASFSCTDVLDVEPTSVITTASFWQTENDAQGALVGMYVNLRTIATTDLYVLGEARSDVLTLGIVGGGGWDKYYFNTLHADNAGPSWQNFYSLINSANLIIKYVPDIDFASEENKNNILAQAYAMRAYAYYVMTRTWGDLPLRIEPTESTDAEVTQIERSSQAEIFTLIKSDIDQANQLFPDNSIHTDRSFWSKPGVNALKADVYLWSAKVLGGGQSDLQTALSAISEVESADVALLDDYASVFAYENKGNDEIIMAARFAEFEVGNNYHKDLYLINSAIPSNITAETRALIGPVGGGNNIIRPTDFMKSLYDVTDSRKDATFYEIFTLDDNGQPTVYYTTIGTKGSGTVSGGARLYVDDYIIYRYADILLMKAEIKNALDQDPSTEINQILMRAYGDNFAGKEFVSGTKAENDAFILEERLRELAFEGKRWWDLIRFDKVLEMVPTLNNDSDKLLWPISSSILSLETKVTQNPGY
ncbi:RagB/SusD family nutrient uptake outer membrane protein [Membranihabitans marinus]|uniref:RagB/SusD family nutrient uptake outer membrane protein n=1 Tax=Membranihabitans marinus TaxID=1227546 RepID=UPI001F26F0D8|nr:RagB/SusD family nutrient uptake outer membrane protein [Membranihabitans marinus]